MLGFPIAVIVQARSTFVNTKKSNINDIQQQQQQQQQQLLLQQNSLNLIVISLIRY